MLPTGEVLLNTPLGNEPSRAILDFRLPQGFCKGGSLKKGMVADYGLAAE